jgi:ATP-binding cassette, subfamily B, bacterial PglK
MIHRYLRDYLLALGPARSRLPLIAGLMVLSALLDVAGLGLVVPMIGTLFGHRAEGEALLDRVPWLPAGLPAAGMFAILGGAVFLAFVAKGMVAYRMQHAIIAFSEHQRRDLMVRLMRSYLMQPHEFHLQRNSATLVSTIIQATHYYSNSTLAASMKMGADALMLVAIVVLLSITDLLAVLLLAALGSAVFLVYNLRFRRRAARAGERALDASQAIVGAVNQGIGSYKESKVLGVESYFSDIVHDHGSRLAAASAEMQAISAVPRYLVECSMVVFLVLFGGVSLASGQSPAQIVPTLALFAASGLRIMPAVTSMMSAFHGLRFSRASLRLIAEDLRGASAAAPPAPRAGAPKGFGSLELRNVTYSYPGASAPAVRSLSMSIARGEAIGVIGRSGAGKSTLADIILGLLRPQAGEILVDGADLWQDRAAWFRQIAYIPQSIFLLDDSVRRNIALGMADDEIDERRVREALSLAQLEQVVRGLPRGLDTVLGERGARLSGGERQRVAIARALYHDRSVIVMDEATAALDIATELDVVATIKELKRKRTLVIVAHRPSTLEGCDWIYRLDGGSLVSRQSFQAAFPERGVMAGDAGA